MKLALSDADLAFRDELREFFTTTFPADIRERARTESLNYPEDVVNSMRILNDAGLAVPNWPVEWGGKDWTPLQRQIWSEEMRMACVPEPLAFNASMVGPVIAEFGSTELKERFLPATANLDIWWCQGFSEPEAGSDLASLRTTAVRDGDHYIINGQKTWTTLGQYADWIFLLARTDPNAPKKQAGISFILAEMSTPGITVRPIKLIDGSYEVNEVWFEDVRVPADQLVGEENAGWSYAKFLLSNERSGIARVGISKVWLTEVKERAAKTPLGSGTLLEDPLRRPGGRSGERTARARVDPTAGQRRRGRRQAEPGVVHPQTARVAVTAGGDRIAGRGGRTGRTAVRGPGRGGLPGLGAACRTAIPELPQDVDLRRQQRGAAHHHRLDDSGTVTFLWERNGREF